MLPSEEYRDLDAILLRTGDLEAKEVFRSLSTIKSQYRTFETLPKTVLRLSFNHMVLCSDQIRNVDESIIVS